MRLHEQEVRTVYVLLVPNMLERICGILVVREIQSKRSWLIDYQCDKHSVVIFATIFQLVIDFLTRSVMGIGASI